MDTAKCDYLLLFRGSHWSEHLSPEQVQQVVSDWYDWFEGVKAEGKCIGGHPLKDKGKIVSGPKGRNVADGPFAESKEAIGGYFYLRVADLDEAITIAQKCPGLDHGVLVEVRPVAELCEPKRRAEEAVARAAQAATVSA